MRVCAFKDTVTFAKTAKFLSQAVRVVLQVRCCKIAVPFRYPILTVRDDFFQDARRHLKRAGLAVGALQRDELTLQSKST